MARQRIEQASARRGGWRWLALGVLALITVGSATVWFSGSLAAASGTPRLVVDRTGVDLGYLRFGAPARAVFTLRNTGDGTLRLKEVPRVIAKAGC